MPSRTQLSQAVILRSSFWRVAIGVVTVTVILIEPGVWLYEWLTNRTPLMCLIQNVPRGVLDMGAVQLGYKYFNR